MLWNWWIFFTSITVIISKSSLLIIIRKLLLSDLITRNPKRGFNDKIALEIDFHVRPSKIEVLIRDLILSRCLHQYHVYEIRLWVARYSQIDWVKMNKIVTSSCRSVGGLDYNHTWRFGTYLNGSSSIFTKRNGSSSSLIATVKNKV